MESFRKQKNGKTYEAEKTQWLSPRKMIHC